MVAGAPVVGQQLTASKGSWSGGPTHFGYKWFSCAPSGLNCSPVKGSAKRTLTLYRRGVFVMKFPVAVGKASTPSPTGLFYVTDKIATGQPGGAYGPYALGLSGFSNVLFTFGGGDGEVGIHGTNETSSVGHPVTHGCIRLYNRDITKLYSKIWIGTPVVVR